MDSRAAIESEIKSKERDNFYLTDLKENQIKGRIQIKNDGMLFFSIPQLTLLTKDLLILFVSF